MTQLNTMVSVNPDGPGPGEAVATPGSDGPKVASNARRLHVAYQTHRAALGRAESLLRSIQVAAQDFVGAVARHAQSLVPMLGSIADALAARAAGVSGLSNTAIGTALVAAGLIEKVSRGGVVKSDANRYIALARWSNPELCSDKASEARPIPERDAVEYLASGGIMHEGATYHSTFEMLEAGIAMSAVYAVWAAAIKAVSLEMQGLDPDATPESTPLIDRTSKSVARLSADERAAFIDALAARFAPIAPAHPVTN